MRLSLLFLVVFSIFLSACSMHHDMSSMPCHQMPDGSWMGACEDDEDSHFTPPEKGVEGVEASASQVIDPDGVVVLDARPVTFSIHGHEVQGYGYNGQLPGPMLQVDQHERVEIAFTNNLPEPTTVHWHGLRHDIANDGMPGMSQDPVMPGETFDYELYFPDEGLFWYHPHIREDRQQDLGLAGLMRVGSSKYNEEYIVLDDLLFEQGYNVNYGKEHANYALMGRFGNTLMVNGKESFHVSMEAGEIRRFFFANVANARPFRIEFEDALVKAVGGDIGWYEQEAFVDHVIIGPAERVAVDVQFSSAGTYSVLHKGSSSSEAIGTIEVVASDSVQEFVIESHSEVAEDIDTFRPYFDMEPNVTLTLSVDMHGMDSMPCHQMNGVWMGDCDDQDVGSQGHEREHIEHGGIEWEDDMAMMNLMSSSDDVEWQFVDEHGNVNMDIDLEYSVGDVVKIRLVNTMDSDHPMQHPIHLHGQRFLVTSVDGVEPMLMGWEDTVLVAAGSTVDILVDVTNPGMWMMHCHIAEHLEAGMMVHFEVVE